MLHYILDGYNLTRSSHLFGKTLEEERSNLINYLITKRPHGSARNRVTVVFDSREMILSPNEQRGDIEIRYSKGKTADEAILDFVDAAKNKKILVVVTNDRGLQQRLRGSGAKVIKVDEFL